MNPTESLTWRCDHSIETSASPAAIWRLFADVPGWKRWNAGIERIELRGPFGTGTEFLMTPPGQPTFTSRLIDVKAEDHFVDETCVGGLVVRVAHRIHRLGPGRTCVVYSVEAVGPGAAEVGPAISADFPDVLLNLARLAESEP